MIRRTARRACIGALALALAACATPVPDAPSQAMTPPAPARAPSAPDAHLPPPVEPKPLHVARAGVRFALGASLTDAFYSSRRFSADLLELLASRPIRGAVAYSTAMAPFVPAELPLVLDSFQPFLRELRPEDLSGSAAVFRIKEEMMVRATATLGAGQVKDILIQDLVQQ